MELAIRRLPLTGLKNARELGGFPTKDGKVTKYGQFIRTELPRKLTEGDLDYLRQYGVKVSVDLRGRPETEHLVSMLRDVDWCRYYHEPVFNEQVAMGDRSEEKRQKEPVPAPDPFIEWGKLYISMVEQHKDWTRRVLSLAAEAEGVMQYHCSTGKDRTGILTALLLSIAGVPEEDIIADYCVSQVYMRPVYEELTRLMPPLPNQSGESVMPDIESPFFKTSPENMRQLLEHWNEKYGSVEQYILDCGVTQEAVAAIRRKLVGE